MSQLHTSRPDRSRADRSRVGRASFARGLAAAVLAASAVLGGSGTASAQSVDMRDNTTPVGPVYEVAEVGRGEIRDPFLTGQIPLVYRAGGGCTTAAFATPGAPRAGVQVLVDQDLPPESTNLWVNPMDWRKFVRTSDQVSVSWTNHTNGRTGVATGQGSGFSVGAQFDSGPGEVTGRVELTSSALPPLPGGSIEQPFVERTAHDFALTVPGCG